jgi:hypothetical protein
MTDFLKGCVKRFVMLKLVQHFLRKILKQVQEDDSSSGIVIARRHDEAIYFW